MRFIGPSLWDSFRNLYGFDAADLTRAVDYYRQYYFTKGTYESALYPGIRALLKTLKENRRKTAIASAKLESSVAEALRYHDIGHMCDIVIGSTYDGSYSDKAEMIADC
jgi:phosphoglycolate phosphatase